MTDEARRKREDAAIEALERAWELHAAITDFIDEGDVVELHAAWDRLKRAMEVVLPPRP